ASQRLEGIGCWRHRLMGAARRVVPEPVAGVALHGAEARSTMTSLHRIALWASLALLAAAIALFALERPQIAGPVLVAFFAAMAFGVRGSEKLRGISFSLVIFAAVSFAMWRPAPLVSWGEFQLSALIVPLLQIIMFGMGTAMSARDFVAVVKSPKAVL